MSTTTEDKWVCPECNVEMVNIGRREMKVPMIGESGMAECAFYPNQYRCPVCQTIAYNGADLIEQLRSRQKTQIAITIIQAADKVIAASNRLHHRRNRIRGLWGIFAFSNGMWAITSIMNGFENWWLIAAVSLLSIASIFERNNFTTKEVWDEVPDGDSKSSDESGVM